MSSTYKVYSVYSSAHVLYLQSLLAIFKCTCPLLTKFTGYIQVHMFSTYKVYWLYSSAHVLYLQSLLAIFKCTCSLLTKFTGYIQVHMFSTYKVYWLYSSAHVLYLQSLLDIFKCTCSLLTKFAGYIQVHFILLFNIDKNTMKLIKLTGPGSTVCLTADPGVTSLIPAHSCTFIDSISSPLLIHSRRVVASYK